MITVGDYYKLEVLGPARNGVFLDAGELGEVLLPHRHVQEDLSPGDEVDVFLYLDTEDRPIATTETPTAKVGQFAYLPVVEVTNYGAFLDWGLDKDVLVPFSEQHKPMEAGHSYLVYLFIDKIDRRITASSKIDKFLDDDKPHSFKAREAVNLIIANSTDLGFKAIINHSHWGVLYKNKVFQRLSFGQSIQGFIKQVREDGRIDLSLQGGQVTRDKNSALILSHLNEHNGFSPVHDKSDPKLIADTFGLSKGAFKKTIGGLYKQRLIRIEKDGIYLIGD
jgi:predicted RNA-binding protein (virulence factor B family)